MIQDESKAKETIPLKKDTLDSKQVKLWTNRCKTALKFHRKEFVDKYKSAKARYNSECTRSTRAKGLVGNQDINLLFKDVTESISSLYHKNPQIDLTCRNEQDDAQRRNIENLEQIVNDDIKDDRELKALLRSVLLDEHLASVAGVYIDHDYRLRDAIDESENPIPIFDNIDDNGNPVPMLDDAGQPMYQQEQISNKICVAKIMPENIIRPPHQKFYNYKSSPYLGFEDIVSLEKLRGDKTLNTTAVKKLKGKTYDSLLDVDKEELKKDGEKLDDDMLFVKIFVVFIKGEDTGPLKRLVLADQEGLEEPLAYGDYSKGHGRDGDGYPIHLLSLNDAADGFIAPSEAWILEPVMEIIDYLFRKMNSHLKKSKTRTFVKAGKEGLKKTDIFKWVKNEDLEVFGLNNLAPGVDIRSLLYQVTDQPLSGEHIAMFELAKRIFDELSRKPSFSQEAVLTRKKTATEAEAIKQNDMAGNVYIVDKFRDFLCDLFYDWSKLRQSSVEDDVQVTVENKEAGLKEVRTVGQDEVQGEFNADINVESFIAPNKELKRRIIKEAYADAILFQPLLKEQGLQLNGKKMIDGYFENVDVRDSEDLVIKIPTRDAAQQVMDFSLKGIPFNADELGKNFQDSIMKLMQIFGDDEMMAKLEPLSPGISDPNGPIVNFALALEQMMGKGGQSKPKGSKMQAENDMAANANQLGKSQTAA